MTPTHLSAAPAIRRGPRRRNAATSNGASSPATAPSSRPALAAIALGGLGAFATTGILVRNERPTRGRSRLDRAVRRDGHGSLRDLLWPWGRAPTTGTLSAHAVSRGLGHVSGKLPSLIAMSLASAALGARRGVRPALPMLAAMPLVLGTSEALKPAIRRPRPWTARLMGKTSRSFPSGHAARAAAMFGLAAHVARREGLLSPTVARSLAVALPLAVGASRIHVDRHWATDIIGGLGYGAAAAALCAWWYDAVTV